MHKILASLHKDHVHLGKLLVMLEKQAAAFFSGEKYDLFIMIDIVDYIRRYSDDVHHPKEDVVYKVFLECSDEAADKVDLLMHDHQSLPSATLELQSLLESVANVDAAVSREEFNSKINKFINLQITHMNLEEVDVFPQIDQALDAKQWKVLEASMSETNDPLFGGQVADNYKRLYQQISLEVEDFN